MRDLSGKVVFLDQFGVLDFTEKTTRVGQTVLNEAPTTRRSMRPRTFTKAIGYDEFDATRLGDMDLPVSKTIEGLQAAAGRRRPQAAQAGSGQERASAFAHEAPLERLSSWRFPESGFPGAGLRFAAPEDEHLGRGIDLVQQLGELT